MRVPLSPPSWRGVLVSFIVRHVCAFFVICGVGVPVRRGVWGNPSEPRAGAGHYTGRRAYCLWYCCGAGQDDTTTTAIYWQESIVIIFLLMLLLAAIDCYCTTGTGFLSNL